MKKKREKDWFYFKDYPECNTLEIRRLTTALFFMV